MIGGFFCVCGCGKPMSRLLWPVGFFKVTDFPGPSCAEASPKAEAAAATLLQAALVWCLEKLGAQGVTDAHKLGCR